MRVAVTGARGLLGSRLCLELWNRGHEVVGLLRAPVPSSPGPQVEYRLCDLTDARAVEGIIADARPEVVINTASMTDVDRCERNPELAYGSNVEATAHLCRAARSTGVHLIHVSTDYVFDG